MSAALFFLLLPALSPHIVFSYNIDTGHPIVYEDPEPDGTNFFGYSLSLSHRRNDVSSISLFVGAPYWSNGEGRVYRCTKSSTGNKQNSPCQPLRIDDKDATRTGWLGASMAEGKNSNFTVCAPRTEIPGTMSAWVSKIPLIQGTCYTSLNPEDSSYPLHRENDPDNFGDPTLNSSIANGFSVNYATKQGSDEVATRIVGQPGVSSVYLTQLPHVEGVEKWDKWNEQDPKIGGSQLGYSVTSGRYFNQNLHLAAGAPSCAHTGMVMIFAPFQLRSDSTIQINGSYIGESFGGSLTTGDFDNDGFDDLAVGAPHWGTVDFGRVYIYHGNKNGIFERGQTLEGQVEKGEFGYTLASADLDHDGFSDLVVGAPWEESGVVYVYYGSSEFGNKSPSSPIIQRIRPSEFKLNYPIQRFGFSFSHPIDVDSNGYPDLAIGAYKSGHAVVLRSRPVIDTKIDLIAYPAILQKNDTQFIASVCVTYKNTGAPESLDLSFNMTVDTKHFRAENGFLKKFNGSFFRDNNTCVNKSISLITSRISSVDDVEDIPPIEIDISHSILIKDLDESEIQPVLSRKSLSKKKPWIVAFDTGCKNRSACQAKLSFKTIFGGVGDDNKWVVGSGDVSLKVILINDEEPAYQTRLTIEMPPGIRLRKTIEHCTDNLNGDILTLSCDIANPLRKGKPKSVNMDLDMRRVNIVSFRKTILFHISIQSRGEDQESRPRRITAINLINITLTGATDKENLDYAMTEEKSKVNIQHEYQVLRSGPTPIIGDAYLTVTVPTSAKRSNDTFLNINNPKLIDGSGQIHNCTISDSSNIGGPVRAARDVSSVSNEATVIDVDKDIERTIHLNCSMTGVICKIVECRFNLTRPMNDVGNLVLDMTLNTKAFNTSDENPLTIDFVTNGMLTIKDQSFSDFTTPLSAEVLTIFNYSANNMLEPEVLSSWILPCSIIFGILLLCVLAFILYKVGFFKRSKKLETAKATKDPELTLHVEDKEGTGDRTSLHTDCP